MNNENLNKRFNWLLMMLLVSVFQVITAIPVITKEGGFNFIIFGIFIAYIFIEWMYFFVADVFCGQNNFELETIGFLFSGIGLTVSASVYDDYALKQMLAIVLGLFVFITLIIILRRTDIVMKLRMPVAFAAVGLLALNLVLAEYNNGALNWITVAGFSIQPSEIVKLAFIFVGAASLDKLQSAKSITKYVIFSIGCVGALFLMRDFGTALIFFFTFVIIAFMRSGDMRTIVLVCVAAALGAIMIIYFRPTVAARFSTYRHIWEQMNEAGMQQTRVLIYSVSGGLFGLGIGNGNLKHIFASTTDLVFGILCEEWGMIVALLVVMTYVFILLYAIKVARTTRSAFYAIAACAAAGLMLFQTALNVFGVTDILPLTGVTLPFISRGGSSMICSWGLLAFIKAADIRTYPKLSKTILPEHPLYPPDIRIGRASPIVSRNNRPAPQGTRRRTVPNVPVQTPDEPTRTPRRQAPSAPAPAPRQQTPRQQQPQRRPAPQRPTPQKTAPQRPVSQRNHAGTARQPSQTRQAPAQRPAPQRQAPPRGRTPNDRRTPR
ncbi:MAG: FtsW/RodA/SpoVE family cell cycle protein [Acutalibacteraceae bacterium]|nr:FtsW/RodA/SpoVE family cell cycle protein [Acutalibacteraceae bacterium]